MATEDNPTLGRILLGQELRKLRDDMGLTAEQIAEHMETKQPWITRIESGKRGIQIRDLRRLLDLYEVTDEAERERLLALGRRPRQSRTWLRPYKDSIPPRYAEYIRLEEAAATIKNYENATVPGLLQTEPYARDVLGNGVGEISAAEVDVRVTVRMQRQERILDRKDPPRIWMILDEAVLHRRVGGNTVMIEQLDRLLEFGRRSRCTLQVVPYAVGAYPGTAGSFAMLDFGHPNASPVPYVETVVGDLYPQKHAEIDTCSLAWEHLVAKAAAPDESARLIADIKQREYA